MRQPRCGCVVEGPKVNLDPPVSRPEVVARHEFGPRGAESKQDDARARGDEIDYAEQNSVTPVEILDVDARRALGGHGGEISLPGAGDELALFNARNGQQSLVDL